MKQEPVMQHTKPQEASAPQTKPQGVMRKESKPVSADFGPGRPAKQPSEQKVGDEMKAKQQDLSAVQRKPPMIPQDVSVIRFREKYGTILVCEISNILNSPSCV